MIIIPSPAWRKWSLSRCQVWLKRLAMTHGFPAVPSEAVVLMWTVASVVQAQWHWIPNICIPGSHFLLINRACHHKTDLTGKNCLHSSFPSIYVYKGGGRGHSSCPAHSHSIPCRLSVLPAALSQVLQLLQHLSPLLSLRWEKLFQVFHQMIVLLGHVTLLHSKIRDCHARLYWICLGYVFKFSGCPLWLVTEEAPTTLLTCFLTQLLPNLQLTYPVSTNSFLTPCLRETYFHGSPLFSALTCLVDTLV